MSYFSRACRLNFRRARLSGGAWNVSALDVGDRAR
jgi:hypothetical protein